MILVNISKLYLIQRIMEIRWRFASC
jgi:hypothetical protein